VRKQPRSVRTEQRFARVVEALRHHRGVTPPSDPTQSRQRFGSSGLKINDKIFAMISSKGQFVVKLPRARVDALVASGDGKRFDPGRGRLMKEWLTVATTSQAGWLRLAREAMRFVASQ
jgi:TfoX/Sxy family transcriptional regulator of competence genes